MLQYINRKKKKIGQTFERLLMKSQYIESTLTHDFSDEYLSVRQSTAWNTNPFMIHVPTLYNVVGSGVNDSTINTLASPYKGLTVHVSPNGVRRAESTAFSDGWCFKWFRHIVSFGCCEVVIEKNEMVKTHIYLQLVLIIL
tara:strand:+ start:89 stop:511 length:423 start_codon:yes stop_codon:yes gene_type:complete